jgi:hypothetical protein
LKGGLDGGTCVKCAQDGQGRDARAGKFGSNVFSDAGKAEYPDIKHLSGVPYRFKVSPAEMPKGLTQNYRFNLALVAA